VAQQLPSHCAPAGAALPDATPRTARDALQSRLPHTPRESTPPAGYRLAPRLKALPEAAANDRQPSHNDTSKAAWQQQQQQQGHHASSPAATAAAAAKMAVPRLKLGGLGGGAASAAAAPGSSAAGSSSVFGRAAGSCLSARGAAKHLPGSAGKPTTPLSARGTGVSSTTATPPSARQQGRTPRAAVPAAYGRLATPRASAAAAAPAPAAAAVRRSDNAATEDAEQQLRLLRMQQHQLRHLNALVEASVGAKKENVCVCGGGGARAGGSKQASAACSTPCVTRPGARCCCLQVHASIAAAAAAVVDLSGQVMRVNDQMQKHAWHGQLQGVVQQQLAQLQAWATAQVRGSRPCLVCATTDWLVATPRRALRLPATRVLHSCRPLTSSHGRSAAALCVAAAGAAPGQCG
jgi:hypothetical protein